MSAACSYNESPLPAISLFFFSQDTITSIGIYSTGQRNRTFMRNEGGDQSWFTSSVSVLLGWGGSCLEGFPGRLGLLGGRCGGLWWLSEKGEAEAERGHLHLHEAVFWSYATCVWLNCASCGGETDQRDGINNLKAKLSLTRADQTECVSWGKIVVIKDDKNRNENTEWGQYFPIELSYRITA